MIGHISKLLMLLTLVFVVANVGIVAAARLKQDHQAEKKAVLRKRPGLSVLDLLEPRAYAPTVGHEVKTGTVPSRNKAVHQEGATAEIATLQPLSNGQWVVEESRAFLTPFLFGPPVFQPTMSGPSSKGAGHR